MGYFTRPALFTEAEWEGVCVESAVCRRNVLITAIAIRLVMRDFEGLTTVAGFHY